MRDTILGALSDGGWWYLSELLRQHRRLRRGAALVWLARMEAEGVVVRKRVRRPYGGLERSRWRLADTRL